MVALNTSTQQVNADGTLDVRLRDLPPGARVRVMVWEDGATPPEWVEDSRHPGAFIYRPDLPRTELGAMRGTIVKYDDPFEPVIDPDDWEANR